MPTLHSLDQVKAITGNYLETARESAKQGLCAAGPIVAKHDQVEADDLEKGIGCQPHCSGIARVEANLTHRADGGVGCSPGIEIDLLAAKVSATLLSLCPPAVEHLNMHSLWVIRTDVDVRVQKRKFKVKCR